MNLSKELLDNKNIAEFIQIYEKTNENDEREKDSENLKQYDILAKLTHFYNYTVIPSKPEKPIFAQIPNYIFPTTFFYAHFHFFLQQLLYDLKCQMYDENIKKIDKIITDLTQLSKKYHIEVDYFKLYYHFFSETEKTTRISFADNAIVSKISRDFSFLDGNTSFHDEICKILDKMIQESGFSVNDENDMCFIEDNYQIQFERLLFDPFYPLHDEVNALLDMNKMNITPKQYTQKVLNLLSLSIKNLNIRTKETVFAFSVAIFRAIFSQAYIIRPSFFSYPKSKGSCSKFRTISNSLTFKDIGAPILLLQGCNMNDYVYEKSNSIPEIAKSSSLLTICSFVSSPLDVLMYIYKSLVVLKDFANKTVKSLLNDKTQTLTDSKSNFEELGSCFETIFGLFMISLIISDLPFPEETFSFAVDFAPQNGLAGPLEYARSTATAASIHVDALYMQKHI